jgi:hypothetical protein
MFDVDLRYYDMESPDSCWDAYTGEPGDEAARAGRDRGAGWPTPPGRWFAPGRDCYSKRIFANPLTIEANRDMIRHRRSRSHSQGGAPCCAKCEPH